MALQKVADQGKINSAYEFRVDEFLQAGGHGDSPWGLQDSFFVPRMGNRQS
jgi:hypothetical protein